MVAGAGTRVVCFGGEDPSADSTFTYASCASPSECSGTQDKRKDVALTDLFDDAVEGRSEGSELEGFCWIKAMNPAMLSLEDGVGCT